MPVLQQWRGVWQRAKEYGVYEDFSSETATTVNRFADKAYRYCVSLYGPPKNANKGYKVVQGERSFYANFGTPTITLARNLKSQEQICGTLAHEMYHRVVEGRRGVSRKIWVREMMAILTSSWFLQHQGFQEYVNASRRTLLASEGEADIHLLRSSSSGSRQYLLSGTPVYSEAFVRSIWRISYALQRSVESSDLCAIIKADTLETWVASLPAEDRYSVCRVLALPTGGEAIPCSDKEIGHLFVALQAMGNKKTLVEEFERLVHLQPTKSAVFFYFGYALQEAGRFEEALSVYAHAQELGYANKWLLNNVGNGYWQRQDYVSAGKWFQKAVDRTPDWAQARYWLGWSLKNTGSLTEARQSWEIATTLDDEHFAKLAAKSLEENPLPETANEK